MLLQQQVRDLQKQLRSRGTTAPTDVATILTELNMWHTKVVDQTSHSIATEEALWQSRQFVQHRNNGFRSLMSQLSPVPSQGPADAADGGAAVDPSMRRLLRMRQLLNDHLTDINEVSTPSRWKPTGEPYDSGSEYDNMVRRSQKLQAALLQFYQQYPAAFQMMQMDAGFNPMAMQGIF